MVNEKNNHKHIYKQVSKRGLIYIFTSSEIIFLKKFKKNILDHFEFIDRLCLLTIDEMHLVD